MPDSGINSVKVSPIQVGSYRIPSIDGIFYIFTPRLSMRQVYRCAWIVHRLPYMGIKSPSKPFCWVSGISITATFHPFSLPHRWAARRCPQLPARQANYLGDGAAGLLGQEGDLSKCPGHYLQASI